MDLGSVVDEFLAAGQARGLSDHTLRAYRQDLTAFRRWARQTAPDPLFGKDAVLDWIAAMRAQGYAAATIKRRLACLKVLCRWLEDEERLGDNPFHRLRATIRLPHRLPRNLKAEEIRALLPSDTRPAGARTGHGPGGETGGETTAGAGDAHPHPSHSAATLSLALELMFTTGVRVGELCSVRLRDIDLAAGAIAIRGKGNRERHVFLVDDAVTAQLRAYIASRRPAVPDLDSLLLTPRGLAADPNHIRRLLHRHASDLKLSRRITPHMLRHTAATELLRCGVDIRLVQKLLGHASISTTEIYTHVSDSTLSTTLRKVNPRGRLRAKPTLQGD
jgi:integrase/recombinase XerD